MEEGEHIVCGWHTEHCQGRCVSSSAEQIIGGMFCIAELWQWLPRIDDPMVSITQIARVACWHAQSGTSSFRSAKWGLQTAPNPLQAVLQKHRMNASTHLRHLESFPTPPHPASERPSRRWW